MDDETFEDLKAAEDFAGLDGPTPDATDYKIGAAADSMKIPRGEVHRERQRLGALRQWQNKDSRDGVPPPVKSAKVPSVAKRTAIESLLLMQRAESPHIKKVLDEFVRRTIEELGGWEYLTAGQKGMLVIQKTAMLVVLACEERVVADDCMVAEDGREHPLLRILRDYMVVFRQGQIALGLGLRSRMPREDGMTLERIKREYAARQSERPQLVPEKPSKKASKDKAG